MKNITALRFFALALVSVLLLPACSQDAPEPPTETSAEANQPGQESPPAEPPHALEPSSGQEPDSAAELPEVVVVYGREELVPWLESEDWWGLKEQVDQLKVPHVIITAINPSWQEYSTTLPVAVKKELFYRLMAPLVLHANKMVMDFREVLEGAREEFAANKRISEASLAVVKRLAILLPDMNEDDVETLTVDHVGMESMLEALLYRVDIVPAGLALGQAAYESGYGTSRFAVQGQSLFGQWTYKGDGIKPKEQRTGSKGDHRIKAFEWPFDSVRGYYINLFSHPAYEDFRRLRAELRAAGKPLESLVLADGLLRYSERGKDYVDSLKGIIRVNKLYRADTAVFRDEPLRFLVSEASREDAEKTRIRIVEGAESGEMALILERMRLE